LIGLNAKNKSEGSSPWPWVLVSSNPWAWLLLLSARSGHKLSRADVHYWKQ